MTRPVPSPRGLGRAAAALLALGLVALFALPHPARAEGLGAYEGSSRAHLVRFTLDAPGATPLGTLVEVTAPEASTRLSTGNTGSAFSSLGFPGPVLSNLPQVIATSYQSPVPLPAYPLQAAASTSGPTEVDDSSTVPGGRMHATADDDGAFAETTYPAGGTAAVATIGTSVAKASTVATDVLTTTSSANLGKITLLGGMLTIDAITSTAQATSDGTKAAGDAKSTITGANLLGTPVEIGPDGLTLKSTSVSLAPVKAAIDAVGGPDALLAQQGISIRAGVLKKDLAGPIGTVGTEGLSLAFNTPLNTSALTDLVTRIGLPKITGSPLQVADALAIIGSNQIRSLSLGEAVAAVNASLPQDEVLPELLPTPTDVLPGPTTGPIEAPLGGDGVPALPPVTAGPTDQAAAPRTTVPGQRLPSRPTSALSELPAPPGGGLGIVAVIALLAAVALVRFPARILAPGGAVDCAAVHTHPSASATDPGASA